MNLSKEDLTEDGKRCIIYGELFTTYDAIIDNVVSHTDKVDRLTLSEDNDLLFLHQPQLMLTLLLRQVRLLNEA